MGLAPGKKNEYWGHLQSIEENVRSVLKYSPPYLISLQCYSCSVQSCTKRQQYQANHHWY